MTQMHTLPDSQIHPSAPSVHLVSGDLFASCIERKLMKDDSLEIHCKRGLWSVAGRNHEAIEREARHYWVQYYRDGEYATLLANTTVSNAEPSTSPQPRSQ
jgi:hypothetical protein